MRENLSKIIFFIIIALTLSACALLAYAGASGAWDWLVTTINAIIEQGPAAIVSAILAGYFFYACVLPILILVGFIGLAVLLAVIYNR